MVFICAGKIWQRLRLLDRFFEHQIDALPGTLNQTAPGADLSDAAIARRLLPQNIFLSDARRKPTGGDHFEPARVLPHEDRTRHPIIPMTYRIQNGLANDLLIESRDVPDK